MNDELRSKQNIFTEPDKKAIKRHPIAFNSVSDSSEGIKTKTLDYKWNRLLASDQCCVRATGLTTILI